jgi:hypothetical protein
MIARFDGYGSHTPIMDTIFSNRSINTVLELGVGEFSTRYFIEDKKVKLTSIESQSEEWYEKTKAINPDIVWMPEKDRLFDWAYNLKDMFDLILIDNNNEYRWHLVDRLQKNTRYLILHDTEQSIYNYHLCTLKEGYSITDFVLYRPWVGLITDDIEMRDILGEQFPHIAYRNIADKFYVN